MDLKIIALLIALTGAIVGLSIWSHVFIEASAQELFDHFLELEQTIAQEKWDSSLQKIDQIAYIWSKTKKHWTFHLNHQEINNIDLALMRLQQFIQVQELPSALAEVAALKLMVQQLSQLSTLSLENIF